MISLWFVVVATSFFRVDAQVASPLVNSNGAGEPALNEDAAPCERAVRIYTPEKSAEL
jgi:hypothetical protein